MAWITLGIGFFLFLAGILGQVYSLKTKRATQPDAGRARRFVVRIVLLVAGFWLMAFSVAKVIHLHPS